MALSQAACRRLQRGQQTAATGNIFSFVGQGQVVTTLLSVP